MAYTPEFRPGFSLLEQLLANQQRMEESGINREQQRGMSMKNQLMQAQLPYASSMAQSQNQFELMKALQKKHQADLAQQYAANEPQRFGLESALTGTKIGTERARTGKYGAEANLAGIKGGKEMEAIRRALENEAYTKALRTNPIYQAKELTGRISPEVVAAISGAAALNNQSPFQMAQPVGFPGIPYALPGQQMNMGQELGAPPTSPGPGLSQLPGGMKGDLNAQGMAELSAGPQGVNRKNPVEMNLGLSQYAGTAPRLAEEQVPQALQKQKTQYAQMYPNLAATIQNKMDRIALAHPSFSQKLVSLENIKETISGVNPSVFRSYAGRDGQIKLKSDQAKNAIAPGSAGPQYNELMTFAKTQAVVLASQIRQFYGDSITPQKEQQIQDTFSELGIMTNPDLALKKMTEIIRTVQDEGKNYARPIRELMDAASKPGFGPEWNSMLEERHKEIKEQGKKFVEKENLSKQEKEEAKVLMVSHGLDEKNALDAIKEQRKRNAARGK